MINTIKYLSFNLLHLVSANTKSQNQADHIRMYTYIEILIARPYFVNTHKITRIIEFYNTMKDEVNIHKTYKGNRYL